MNNLSKEELLKLYNEMPVETLQKLGIYEQSQAAFDEKQEMERLKQQRLEKAKALVEEAQELLDRYRLELIVTKRGIQFVDRDGRSVYSDQSKTEDKLPRGVKTPGSKYRIHLLRILVELGGSEQASKVLKLVYEKMKDDFVSVDLEKLSSGLLRWRSTAYFENFLAM